MASVEEIITVISSLKMSSEQLSNMISEAGQAMQERTNQIASLVKGSKTGEEAVVHLNIASRSLMTAATSIKALERTCNECVQRLSR